MKNGRETAPQEREKVGGEGERRRAEGRKRREEVGEVAGCGKGRNRGEKRDPVIQEQGRESGMLSKKLSPPRRCTSMGTAEFCKILTQLRKTKCLR